jgi:hypothetical protein
MIVDNAIYVDGRRVAEPSSLLETCESARRHGGLAWIGLHEPTEEEFSSVAEEFGLHQLAVEDALEAHQRPKLERYDGTPFVVLRPARYIDKTETVEFGEVHVFVGENFVVTVRHGKASDLGRVRSRLEGDPALLGLGLVKRNAVNATRFIRNSSQRSILVPVDGNRLAQAVQWKEKPHHAKPTSSSRIAPDHSTDVALGRKSGFDHTYPTSRFSPSSPICND